jgi:hypothetical protein
MVIVIGLLLVAALARLGWALHALWGRLPRRNEDFGFPGEDGPPSRCPPDGP